MADGLDRTRHGVLGLDHHLTGERLRVGMHFGDGHHRPRRESGTLEIGEPFPGRARAEMRRQHLDEIVEIGLAAMV